ncbi:MAG: HDIG domain-containing protein [Thermoanaerobaculia bacterium]|nr:HDIG domain-containing protein [Thermoanaerobaculia bacterium]
MSKDDQATGNTSGLPSGKVSSSADSSSGSQAPARSGKSRSGRAARGGKGQKGGNGIKSAGRRATRSAVLRRPPEGGLDLARYRAREIWDRVLEMHWAWLVIFLLASTWCMLPQRIFFQPDLDVGDIAPRDFVADRDVTVIDENQTRLLKESARTEVRPVYDFDRSLEGELRGRLGALFQVGRELTAGGGRGPALEELLAELTTVSRAKVEAEQAALLRDRGFSTQLEDRLGGVLSRVLRQGVVQDKGRLLEYRSRGIVIHELPAGHFSDQFDLYRYYGYPDQARGVIEEDLSGWDDLRSRERKVLTDLLVAHVQPNLTFNSSATLEARDQAAATVGSVAHTFRQGEVIVRKWGKIDSVAAEALSELAGRRDVSAMAISAVGILLLAGATALLLWLALSREARLDRSRQRSLAECLILLTLAVVGVRFSHFVAAALATANEQGSLASAASYGLAVPFAAVALISVLLYGRNIALVISLVFSLFAGHLGGGEEIWTTTVYSLASCLAAVFALDQTSFHRRSAMTRAGAVIALVDVLAILTLRTMPGSLDGGLSRLGLDLLCGAAGGLLAAAVTSFAVPIFEGAYQITTSIKLVELANPNLPLLRRLAFEAPGTFQHSLAVANLSKAGVEAIDGDSVLVHTGALYHDIGKIFRPRYFVENQPPNQNPHDKIQPSMSALILINHVKEGLEMAVKQGLPGPIFDAIEQHHGTRLIKFFYARAKERSDPETEEVREEEFRYSGPKPQSKEMGVLMLADAVEAASRTLVDPSRQKLRTVLRAVFDDCLQDDQLDQTDLTLGDLHKVEDAFLRVLTNVYHRRVDYPGFDFNKQKSAKPVDGNKADGGSGLVPMPGDEPARAAREALQDSGEALTEEAESRMAS